MEDKVMNGKLMQKELEVFICRTINRTEDGVAISISEISGVHWDNISGGVHRRQAGYSLYGYIDYDLAYEFGLCSGRHSYYREDAKICIPNSCNKGDYRKGYLELKRDAGEKPKANYRKPRQKPCTQQVCLLLSEVPYFFRKDLRQRLKEMEYTVNIARALKRLIEQGKSEQKAVRIVLSRGYI